MSHSMPKWPNRAVAARNDEVVRAAGRVRPRRPDVRADELRRQQQLRPALDALALERVVGVARPHAVGAGEDAEVDAGAARRAALDLHARMAGAQLVEQPVDGERLVVGRRDEVAVVVPLEVRDVVLGQQGVEPLEDVRVRLRDRDVEPLLVAPRRAGEDPVRMRAGEVGVGVDHLRLDPQAELHARARARGRRAGAARRARRPRRRTSRRGPAVSSRRWRNQPSSSTNRSTPSSAAVSASAFSRSSRWSKYTASHVLSTTGRGRAGWLGRERMKRCRRALSPSSPSSDHAA